MADAGRRDPHGCDWRDGLAHGIDEVAAGALSGGVSAVEISGVPVGLRGMRVACRAARVQDETRWDRSPRPGSTEAPRAAGLQPVLDPSLPDHVGIVRSIR